jgi:hypothetical protein
MLLIPQTEYSPTYLDNKGSCAISLNNTPSVQNLIFVTLGVLTSSNRMVYPTSPPRSQPLSSATLAATVIAATRRGCVTAMHVPVDVHPASIKYCGTCDGVCAAGSLCFGLLLFLLFNTNSKKEDGCLFLQLMCTRFSIISYSYTTSGKVPNKHKKSRLFANSPASSCRCPSLLR